jgi:hypothetical protein
MNMNNDRRQKLMELLDSQDTVMLEWVEPWPARGPKENKLDAHITIKATVRDCINLQRETDRKEGRITMDDDLQKLDQFIVVNFARVVWPNVFNI